MSIIRRRTSPEDFEQVVGGVVGGSSFDDKMRTMFTKLLMGVVSQSLAYCFGKYTEKDYHSRMEQGFSFIKDWQDNHADKLTVFVSRARRVRRFLNLDEDDLLRRVEKIMTGQGWVVTPAERAQILIDLREIKRLIFSD